MRSYIFTEPCLYQIHCRNSCTDFYFISNSSAIIRTFSDFAMFSRHLINNSQLGKSKVLDLLNKVKPLFIYRYSNAIISDSLLNCLIKILINIHTKYFIREYYYSFWANASLHVQLQNPLFCFFQIFTANNPNIT